MSFPRNALSVAGFLWLAVPAAFAQGIPPSLVACSEEGDDAARLACFDREIARLKQPSESVASTQVPPVQVAPPAPPVATTQPQNGASREDEFGLSGELARRRKEQEKKPGPTPEALQAVVTRVSKKAYGELVFELDNGQVWEQPEKKYVLLIKAGEHIRITRGAVGSYFLTAESGATTRVRRTR